MRDLPVACTLSAAELDSRRGDLLPGLIARSAHRLPLADLIVRGGTEVPPYVPTTRDARRSAESA